MSQMFVPHAGAVFSADIAVPEHARQVRFYSRVLSTGNDPLWREDLMNNLGMPIIGLGQRTAEFETLPLQWMPHLQVDDVAKSAAKAQELGGKELLHHRDGAGNSQWAVLQDPNGTAFGIIPVAMVEAGMSEDAKKIGKNDRVGRIAWLDMAVPNADATRDFYSAVVGWSVQEVEMKDGYTRYADYSMLRSDGAGAAGICHARGTNRGLPPVWLMYLPVGDFDESVRRAEAEGGTIVRSSTDPGAAFRYAVIRDLVGAHFAIFPG